MCESYNLFTELYNVFTEKQYHTLSYTPKLRPLENQPQKNKNDYKKPPAGGAVCYAHSNCLTGGFSSIVPDTARLIVL